MNEAATFIEALPETKSSKHSGIRWTPEASSPVCGLMLIDTDRSRTTYRLAEFSTAWEGRAFKFTKTSAGTDIESDSYSVFICSKGRGHICDCKGFAYGKGKNCKHLESILALMFNRWI